MYVIKPILLAGIKNYSDYQKRSINRTAIKNTGFRIIVDFADNL